MAYIKAPPSLNRAHGGRLMMNSFFLFALLALAGCGMNANAQGGGTGGAGYGQIKMGVPF